MANGSGQGRRANARFVANRTTETARLEVTRHIKAGDEILVAYGQEYWRSAHLSHSTVDIPEWEWDLSDPFAPLLGVVSPPMQVEVTPCAVSPSPIRAVLVGNQPLTLSSPAMTQMDPPRALSPPREFVGAPLVGAALNPEDFCFVGSPPPTRLSSCLSPGPISNGSPPDPSSLGWPFSVCPDWPMNEDWLRFAFAPVSFSFRVDVDPDDIPMYSRNNILCLENENVDNH
jgi:hypothetical protein